MKAMTLDDKLDFVWQDVPDPVCKNDEVLIEVHAAAVNRADLMQKDGKYASPPEWPQWCGLEVAGIVIKAPADSGVRVGDKVCALVGGGGYSEKIAVPAGMVIPVPQGFSLVEAAALPEVWCTAYLNLVYEAGGLKPGEVFYVQAGASGVGLAAIQLAKGMGAKVVTTVSTPEKADFLRRLGADIVVNYKLEDVCKVLAENPPAVALDCIGGEKMGECMKHMVFGGRWIMIASMGGSDSRISLENIWRKRLKLIGSTLRSRTNEEKTKIMQALKNELFPLFSQQKLVSNIHAVFPIAEVEKAHAVLRRSENIGKVVLTLR